MSHILLGNLAYVTPAIGMSIGKQTVLQKLMQQQEPPEGKLKYVLQQVHSVVSTIVPYKQLILSRKNGLSNSRKVLQTRFKVISWISTLISQPQCTSLYVLSIIIGLTTSLFAASVESALIVIIFTLLDQRLID